MDTLIGILQAALGIGVLIFIHEGGHFLAARFAGVRVEVFSLGFGPRLFGVIWRGTDYRFSAVPVGGYVRVAGEDPTQRDNLAPDELYAKGFGARALFFSGGVLMNLLFALVAFPIVFHRGVEFPAPVLGTIEPGGGAWEAGLQPGDRIVSLDGKPMYSFDNLITEVALAGEKGGDAVVERDGKTLHVPIRPEYSEQIGLYELGANPPVDRLSVVDVASDGPAAAAGLEEGDVIAGVDGTTMSPAKLLERLRDVQPGQSLKLSIDRDGKRRTVDLVAGSRKDETPRLGVVPARRRVEAVRPGPATTALGIRTDDVVLAIDGAPFWGEDPEATFRQGSGPLTVAVLRDGNQLELHADGTPQQREDIAADVAFAATDPGPRIVPQPDTPAARAGLQAGDVIDKIDGREIHNWDALVEAVHAAGTSNVAIVVRRGDQTKNIEVAPAEQTVADLGFGYALHQQVDLFQRKSVGGAIQAGFVASWDLVKQLYVTLKRIVTGDVAARNLGGIITISRVSYHYARSGWERFVYFLALLSINLAFINVLPIPVLDGGHLMFLLIERIKGSPVSATVLNYSQILGLVFVLALLVFVTYHDILRLL